METSGISSIGRWRTPLPGSLKRGRKYAAGLGNLAWFLTTAVRTAPLPCTLWALGALAVGAVVPAQLWLTKRLVDVLAAHLAGLAGASGWLLWLSLLAGLLILQQILSGLLQWVQVLARERIGPSLQEQVMKTAAGLDTVLFEHQQYYDRVTRVLSDTEGRGPRLVGNVVQLLQSIPPLIGYALALATLSPVLFALTLAGMVPGLIESAVSGQKGWNLLYQQTRERRLAAFYASILRTGAMPKKFACTSCLSMSSRNGPTFSGRQAMRPGTCRGYYSCDPNCPFFLLRRRAWPA